LRAVERDIEQLVGPQLGKNCPKLKSDPKHGTWGCYLSRGSDPKAKKRRQFRRGGYKSRGAAESAMAKLKTELDANAYVSPQPARWVSLH
jgi:hypothetical protein